MTVSYPVVLNDGGRSLSRRPKQKNDCTVRALALAARINYDDAYDMLAAAGRKSGRGMGGGKAMGLGDYLKKNPVINGYRFVWESYPAVAGQKRMNIASFCQKHGTGTYVCRSAGHWFVVQGGVVYDDHTSYDERCVYGAFRVVKVGR